MVEINVTVKLKIFVCESSIYLYPIENFMEHGEEKCSNGKYYKVCKKRLNGYICVKYNTFNDVISTIRRVFYRGSG